MRSRNLRALHLHNLLVSHLCKCNISGDWFRSDFIFETLVGSQVSCPGVLVTLILLADSELGLSLDLRQFCIKN